MARDFSNETGGNAQVFGNMTIGGGPVHRVVMSFVVVRLTLVVAK